MNDMVAGELLALRKESEALMQMAIRLSRLAKTTKDTDCYCIASNAASSVINIAQVFDKAVTDALEGNSSPDGAPPEDALSVRS